MSKIIRKFSLEKETEVLAKTGKKFSIKRVWNSTSSITAFACNARENKVSPVEFVGRKDFNVFEYLNIFCQENESF